jgi:hypothetical protein
MTDDYCSYGSTWGPVDYEKGPSDTEDYPFNWSGKLDGDTISTSTFLLPDGLTEVSTSNTDTTATIFVSGGSACITYRITNRITTAGGRTWDKTIRVRVSEL